MVRRVLQLIWDPPDRAELFEELPEFEEADLQQALAYAAAAIEDRVFELSHAS